MQISPEEKRKIYEEEKARIEAEQRQRITYSGSSTGLEPNIAGMLCYLGGWISGIVFLVIEQKNGFVRFHALQSIVTFGALTVVATFLNWIPTVGGFFGAVVGLLAFVLWIVLMVKAYQGDLYKMPLAGDIAEGILPTSWRVEQNEKIKEEKASQSESPDGITEISEPRKEPALVLSEKMEQFGKKMESYFEGTRAGRVAGYSASIFWNVVLLVFLSFFHRYIAWYHIEPDGGVIRLPLLTDAYFIWLPILAAALIISIAANIVLITYDRYWFREVVQIVLSVVGVTVVANLVSIFPFDFSVIPNTTAVDVVPMVLTLVLIIIAVGLGVGALVRFIKLIAGLVQQNPS